jgi:hypothetical protein
LKTAVLTDISPLDVLLAADALYERAGIAGRIDVEDLLNGFSEVHVVCKCCSDEKTWAFRFV